MSKKKLADFLIDLSKDPDKQVAFMSDPDGFMQSNGFSEEDTAVVKTADTDKIREHLGDDDPPGCCVALMFII